MFSGAQSFDEDLSGWRPRRLRTFDGLFSRATAFRGRGLGAWSSENLANNSLPCGPTFYGTRCTPLLCARPAWCYNASIFEAQINVTQRKFYKQLCADASTAAPCICRPATNGRYTTTGLYTVLIEGRLDGLLTMAHRSNEQSIKFRAIYAWGNVSLASPPAYMRDGTLLSGYLSIASALHWGRTSEALTELFYLAPTSGTRALERVTRADYLFYNAYGLVGDLSDWRVPFNGSATYALANAKKFNQDISAWPMNLSAWSRPTTPDSCQGVASDSRLTRDWHTPGAFPWPPRHASSLSSPLFTKSAALKKTRKEKKTDISAVLFFPFSYLLLKFFRLPLNVSKARTGCIPDSGLMNLRSPDMPDHDLRAGWGHRLGAPAGGTGWGTGSLLHPPEMYQFFLVASSFFLVITPFFS
eukprot:g50437.t1